MRHIESKTGKSYSICTMNYDHLINTVELLIRKCKLINETKENNPRYLNDIEDNLKRLALYYLDLDMRDSLNMIIKQEIENIYYEYSRYRAKIHVPT